MVYLTRREQFNAAHKLWVDSWSKKKNNAVFGKCANPNWHGHNYTLFVTVKGKPDPKTGFVMDAKKLSKMVRKLKFHEKKLLRKVDFINWEVDNNLHEVKMMKRYCIQKREDYTM